MAIYQEGKTPPKTSEEQKVKGLRFDHKYFECIMQEDGFIELRPRADVEFVGLDEESGNMKFRIVGEDESPESDSQEEV